MIFDQSEFNIRCEWGEKGVALLAPISDVVIIVDVLSFSTAVDIATSRGALIYPYRWKDETAYLFAESINAEVADKNNERGYSLSPASLTAVARSIRLVLPSPNGSSLSLATGSTPTIAGCLRNCRAVAESAMRKGKNIAVIPAGERWDDGTLRPCLEDLAGAGAIIQYLRGMLSPEARAAVAVFESGSSNLPEQIKSCGSGKEKVAKAAERDIVLASELNASDCVPVMIEGAYKKEA
ncbi:MAG TPA: 2-phosphosulfolactate phosphatase [Blastocatellia bacterium]|nr:2-phosphosulfolactate phosphatase [Blastocatellia bacterium]